MDEKRKHVHSPYEGLVGHHAYDAALYGPDGEELDDKSRADLREKLLRQEEAGPNPHAGQDEMEARRALPPCNPHDAYEAWQRARLDRRHAMWQRYIEACEQVVYSNAQAQQNATVGMTPEDVDRDPMLEDLRDWLADGLVDHKPNEVVHEDITRHGFTVYLAGSDDAFRVSIERLPQDE